ncbi:MAG: phosphoribosylanthranilate isomerase [Candidatus Desulfofervidaceae bacterium]|nr:phosphoribosylanthranilate isomerase [Candidatus Desulfofervidaceae bacterium]
MTRVKICGITNEEDIQLCVCAGVDALGFVVEYPVPVPWNLDREVAKRLMAKVPPFVTKVVVVGDESDKIMAITDMLKPHVVQLHGREPFNVTEKLISELKKRGVQIIKALRFSVETGQLKYDIADPVVACDRLANAGVNAVLLDSFTDSRPAGTGKPFNWAIARRVREKIKIPLILAGGLNAENVGQAIAEVQPYGVDVITGVENPVTKKDPEKVKAFLQAVRQVDARKLRTS